jgi:hypothetical protein
LKILKVSEEKNLEFFTFCPNCCYAICDNHLLIWQKIKNNDKEQIIYNLPKQILSIKSILNSDTGKRKLSKVFCNQFAVHALSGKKNDT